MTNEITTFNFDDQNVRIIVDETGNPWFCAADVCAALGYGNSRDALRKHCKSEGVAKRDTPTNSGIQTIAYIDERNLYRLVMRSKLESAERFQDWVCGEVLPTIRKTGGYGKQQPIAIPQTLPEALRLAADLAEKNQKLLEEQKINAPKVELADTFLSSRGQFLIRQVAKSMGIGTQFLFGWLRTHKWIMKTNEPYATHCTRGYLIPKPHTYEASDGFNKTSFTTYITPKGVKKIHEKLILEGIIPKDRQIQFDFLTN